MTHTKYNTIFQDVKDRVSYEDLNQAVGWQTKKRGNRVWINSPFNSGDKNPSLCQYIGGGWKDYSTGEAGGDIISLYAKAFKIKPIEAAQQLASITAKDYFDYICKPNEKNKGVLKLAAIFDTILEEQEERATKKKKTARTRFISRQEFEANKKNQKWVMDNLDAIKKSKARW